MNNLFRFLVLEDKHLKNSPQGLNYLDSCGIMQSIYISHLLQENTYMCMTEIYMVYQWS